METPRFVVCLMIAFAVGGGVARAEDTRTFISEKLTVSKDICPVVKSAISERLNTAEVVRTSIQMGHAACYVVKCAIQGGGALEQVIYGAVAAGATPDVVSRCCIDGGARPEEVAEIMRRDELLGPGYSDAEGGGTAAIDVPGGRRAGGGFISPSRF